MFYFFRKFKSIKSSQPAARQQKVNRTSSRKQKKMSSIASEELFDAVVSGDLQAVEQGLRGRGVSPNGVWIDNIGKSRSLLYGAAQVRVLLKDCIEVPCIANLFLSILRLLSLIPKLCSTHIQKLLRC